MISWHPTVTFYLVLLAVAFLLAGNIAVFRPWLPPLSWDTVAPVFACPYLQPPECVEPIVGL